MARRIMASEVLRLRSVNGLSQSAIARSPTTSRSTASRTWSRPRGSVTPPGRTSVALHVDVAQQLAVLPRLVRLAPPGQPSVR